MISSPAETPPASITTKAERKEYLDGSSCPIAPDEWTEQRIKQRRRIGIFTGRPREYSGWKRRLLTHLTALKLEHTLVATPEETRPPGETDEGNWRQNRCDQDCEAIDEICTSIEGPPLQQIVHCTYAKETMETLDRLYLCNNGTECKKKVEFE